MREIQLTQGQVALVDDEDFERVNQYKWYAHKSSSSPPSKKRYFYGFYAVRNVNVGGKREGIRLHRFILDAPSGVTVDHINGNTLDNQKSNLRLCSDAENSRNRAFQSNNTTGFKGVCRNGRNRYTAKLKSLKKSYHLGTFDTAIEAAKAYNEKAIELFGEYAKLNKID